MTEQEIVTVEAHLAPFLEGRVGATASPEAQRWIDFCAGLLGEVRLLQGEVEALTSEAPDMAADEDISAPPPLKATKGSTS